MGNISELSSKWITSETVRKMVSTPIFFFIIIIIFRDYPSKHESKIFVTYYIPTKYLLNKKKSEYLSVKLIKL